VKGQQVKPRRQGSMGVGSERSCKEDEGSGKVDAKAGECEDEK
jgi:hypothetical protein